MQWKEDSLRDRRFQLWSLSVRYHNWPKKIQVLGFETSSLSLLGYAWKLWKEEDLSSFIDPFILNPSTEMEIRKCIQIGLLCVQEFAEDRPSISSVLVMLTSETTSLPAPLQPAFTERRHFRICNENRETKFTLNNVSITNLTGR